MKTMLTYPRSAVVIGFLLCLPFAVLEYVFNILNNPRALEPQNLTSLTVLFGLMWLLPTVFLVILMPLVRALRAGNTSMANPVFLLLRVVVLVILAWVWGGILIDQLPCFLGVPNCD